MAAFNTDGYNDISGDGGLLKKILVEGSGESFPQTGDEVIAHYTGTLDDGTVFDSSRTRGKEFKFTIGKRNVIKGWDIGFAGMRRGEKAMLRCRSDYAYGDRSPGSGIPAGATLNFDVELINFGPKQKEKDEMTDDEKVAHATSCKDRGTIAFKDKKFDEALLLYDEAANVIDDVDSAEALWVTCQLNSAQCAINLSNYTLANEKSSQALSKDGSNVKALYRRGLARNHLGLAEEALGDLNRALQLDPENKPVQVEINKAKKLISDAKKREKASYGNMFSKISVYDDKEVPATVLTSSATNPKVFLIILVSIDELFIIILMH
jgi:peptidylprolyl isomerase